MQSVNNSEIRPLEANEIDDVSGGLFGLILAAAGLFAAGVAGGTVLYNVTHGRPWYEI